MSIYLAGASLAGVISNWLAARLGGADGFIPLPRIEHYKEHSLPMLDPLARRP